MVFAKYCKNKIPHNEISTFQSQQKKTMSTAERVKQKEKRNKKNIRKKDKEKFENTFLDARS